MCISGKLYNFCSMLYYILSVELESTYKIGVISSFRNIWGVLCCNLQFPEMYKNLRNLDVQSVMAKIAKKYCSLLSENVNRNSYPFLGDWVNDIPCWIIYNIEFNMDWSFIIYLVTQIVLFSLTNIVWQVILWACILHY